ncbi:aminotransferase class I/II-fold pyridoxal phosphate-dependent enzyme [Mangrovibacillus cuniculi]|uniref:homocysteine desulfhydrase n=1 Tax=Mangrovibacillus cuniculi TaxID=2593652 RepID=A0A7S8CED1_9BACI|nr:aminotransferase class I/II-fold pyridoxal phosphate-dependent enzyme [Mangrovibacillus cuniculi]
MNFETSVAHTSFRQEDVNVSKSTPIYQTSVFRFSDLDELEGFYEGKSNYLYTRMGNPNSDELATAVAELEDAESGVATSSGISAILAGMLSVLKSGDHLVASEDLYGGTVQLLTGELSRFGIEVSYADFTNEHSIRAMMRSNTKMIYSESITNPFLRVENIEQMVRIAKEFNLVSMIDNTFATPYLVKPVEFGVDLVAHSGTKYIGGHSDVSIGVVVGRADLIAEARIRVVSLGANVSPFESWLTVRGLKTLALRMEKQTKNARSLADALAKNAVVHKVYYPNHVLPKGDGAMVTIELSEQVDVRNFFASLGWITIVPSLAGVETTVSYPIATSHRALSEEDQARLGINSHVIRISVGIEHIDDIIKQFEKAIQTSVNERN